MNAPNLSVSGAENMASKKRTKNITKTIKKTMDNEQWNRYKRSEDGRKQARMADKNYFLYNSYAEQEYTNQKPAYPKALYDNPLPRGRQPRTKDHVILNRSGKGRGSKTIQRGKTPKASSKPYNANKRHRKQMGA